jgi:tetratricopeptide (TPR) repeat protein
VKKPVVSFVCVLAIALAPSLAAQTGRAGTARATLPEQVRVALGRGNTAEARQLVESAAATTPGRDLARAIVDIFEGRDDAARKALEPLARSNPLGDAAVELGLLEIRHGRRDEGWRILKPIVDNRTFANEDDYFRLARAARASLEFFLANDAYGRIDQSKRAEVHSEWGDLFLQRHREAEALTSYKQALSLDPGWIPARVGVARALAELADTTAADIKAAVEAVRKAAPNHPDVLLLDAERAMDEDDRDAAKRALDGLAAVKPGTADEAALRAAIAYDEGGAAAIDAPLAALRAVNPRSGLGYRRIAEQAERRYRFDEAGRFMREAGKVDPDDPLAFLGLGLSLMRTGDEKEARTVLEQSWDLDQSNRLTKNLLDLLDTIDKFEVVQAGEFIFKFAPGEAAVLKEYALPLAEQAYKVFQTRYGFKPAGPILVEIFPEHDDFAVRTMGLPGLVGALGACFGRVIGMDSPRARDPGEFSWQATLWHEIAHVFTLQASKFKVPRWLTEGISTYEEHRQRPAWGRELALEFAHLLSEGKTFGVKGLPGAFKRPENLALAYFEASLVVEHLIAVNGDAGLRTLLQAYADGASDEDAFAKAFGRSVEAVDATFKTFVNERYGALAKAMATPPPAGNELGALKARAAAAPDNFISQLALGQALLKAGDYSGARAPLARAATLAPQASGAASPRALLADIAMRENDPARAMRELRQLLEHDHANVMAARRLVELATAAGPGDKAAVELRDFGLRLVADLDPLDADVHGHLGRRLLEKKTRADDQAALTEFRVALALGPANLAEAHTDLSDVLLRLGRKDDAKAQALAALKLAPGFARAQDLLLAAIGRE